ncbi:MAG: tetratricopeptide repeat protein [Deltaproteobacteria bacterium]|nr:tetratricopeptide repeat protein [Deltaproteobacteria bacterium]
MRALGVICLVGLLGCGGARSASGDREHDRDRDRDREEHHPPREESVVVTPPAPRHPEMEDPLATGQKPVFASAEEGYRAGQRAYDLGSYDDAIRAFSAAFELMSHPAFLYNIAQAHRQRGDLRRAIFFYRAYLRLDPESKQREAILERVQELEDELSGRSIDDIEPPVG